MARPKLRAVRSRRSFDALSRSSRRGRASSLWVVAADHLGPDADPGVAVAFAIGRPVGPAVVRNRLRRRLRALMSDRAAAGTLDGMYLIGVAPEAADLDFSALGAELDAALEKLR